MLSSLLALSLLPIAVLSQFSTYRVANEGAADTIFSLTASNSTSSLWFHFESPSDYQWAATAIGEDMSHSLIFLMYAAGTGDDVILSPRLAKGHNIPQPYDAVNCTLVDGPGGNFVNATKFNVNAHCTNAIQWTNRDNSAGSLDLTSTMANFLLGYGPSQSAPIAGNNELVSGLHQHTNYPGPFALDMTRATVAGAGSIPGTAALNNTTGAQMVEVDEGPMWTVAVHGALMLVAFLILYPLGVIVMTAFGKLMPHRIIQIVGMLFMFAGFGIGAYATAWYNRFGGHPIFGVIIIAMVLVQTAFGMVHHSKYKKTQKKSLLGRIHKLALGPLVILAGFGNAFYGFVYSEKTYHAWIPAVVIAFWIIVFPGALLIKSRRNKRAGLANSPRGSKGSDDGQAHYTETVVESKQNA